jgi:hypothetical protein
VAELNARVNRLANARWDLDDGGESFIQMVAAAVANEDPDIAPVRLRQAPPRRHGHVSPVNVGRPRRRGRLAWTLYLAQVGLNQVTKVARRPRIATPA